MAAVFSPFLGIFPLSVPGSVSKVSPVHDEPCLKPNGGGRPRVGRGEVARAACSQTCSFEGEKLHFLFKKIKKKKSAWPAVLESIAPLSSPAARPGGTQRVAPEGSEPGGLAKRWIFLPRVGAV